MEYRRLGGSGVKVSLLSFGSWVTFGEQLDLQAGLECMQAAHDAGVNFFDNAESYAGGKSESMMGQALRELGWPRHSYLVSTKYYWGIHDGPNSRRTLNRKYLLEGIDQSLERFQLDYVDLVFCHRPDPETPIEETVWAMSDMVAAGKAHYWGTSEWSADEILQAWEMADRHHLRKPVMEQPQYNLLHRERVEHEYAGIYDRTGLGLTTYSPLASGVLSGKYLEGIPEGSRAEILGFVADRATDQEVAEKVRRFVAVAADLDCTPAQLAIAWCAVNSRVSTVITGASRVSQVRENLAALEVLNRLDEETHERLAAIF